jgi:hypothetical protein
MTMEFPLSARVSVALFSVNSVLIDFISFDSGCVLLEVFCCFILWTYFIRASKITFIQNPKTGYRI